MTKTKLPLLAITLFSAALVSTGLQAAEKPADKAKPTAEASPAAAPSEKKKDSVPFHGKIASADATAKTVTLEGADNQRVFVITETTKLKKGDGLAKWDDLKAGEEVGGLYKKSADGKMEALSLRVGPKPEKKVKTEGAAEAKPKP